MLITIDRLRGLVLSRSARPTGLTTPVRAVVNMLVAVLALVGPAQVASGQGGSMTTQSADGTSIAYSVADRGEPTIVFVHGWACDQSYWADQVTYFGRTHQVITLDLAGHGGSGRNRTDWTVQRFSDDVAAVVRASGAKKVVLVGHSLGGPVVVEAAHQLKAQTVAVVGVDTFFDVWAAPAFTNLLAQMRTDYPATASAFARTQFFNAHSDPALVASVTRAVASTPPEIGTPALAALIPWATTRSAQALATLGVPLGTIQAQDAGHANLERARPLIPRLDTTVMAGLGHFLMLEDPDRFDTTLSALIDRLTK